MKQRKGMLLAVTMILMILLSACSNSTGNQKESTTTQKKLDSSEQKASVENTSEQGVSDQETQLTGHIYLYGESHSEEAILEKELELWSEYYQEQGMRHLFVELPYYTAEFLNLWMQSDSDDILEELYTDWNGTAIHTEEAKLFYQNIKEQCPETIFHGTDVGHQSDSTGKRFLEYLKSNQLEDSEQYTLTTENIEQGRYYYDHSDDVYRENKMVENFIREFDQLGGENIMGIYGSAHTGLDQLDYTNSVPCMASQLSEKYGDIIYSEDLSGLAKEIDPERVDIINIDGKDYEASYFGKQDLTNVFKGYICREYWRLEDAYEDFKDSKKTNDVLPYNNYPMQIEVGQIFVIDYTKTDGTVERLYYRSDGNMWNNQLTTEGIAVIHH